MEPDLLNLYDQASAWATDLAGGVDGKLDASTPCDEWDLRTLLNHILETQRYFVSSARGADATPPSQTPPETLTEDPAADLETVRQEVLQTFAEDGVLEKTGPSLGIAFTDMLIHGWDIAQASDQDATMPAGLAEPAYDLIHGRFTDDQRKGVFKDEVSVARDASSQDRLLAYTGRDPSGT